MEFLFKETENVYVDYSHVYQYQHNSKGNMYTIRFLRYESSDIVLKISDQCSLYDLYTYIKLECYKSVYTTNTLVKKKRTMFHNDSIPPSQLTCIIHDLVVIDKNDKLLSIPNNPKQSIESFMKANPNFFTGKSNKLSIHVIDENGVQNYKNKPPSTKFISSLKTNVKKYLKCAN
uniref:Uncharacterized protein n=1 Tax=viral metagenome TaxID=1070528 RepID=A0A6C0JGV5_9ZZZZ